MPLQWLSTVCWSFLPVIYVIINDFAFNVTRDCISIELAGRNVISSYNIYMDFTLTLAQICISMNWLTVISEYAIAYAFYRNNFKYIYLSY